MSDSDPIIKPTLFSRLTRKDDIGFLPRAEKIIVFIVAYIIALCLWLLVNLNRDFNLTVNLPIQLAQLPSDQALAEQPPGHANVNIMGEGWKLINIYNNPPPLRIDPRQGSINLFDRAKETMGMFLDINVQSVQPMILNIPIEDKVSKKVPVRSDVNLSFRRQFDLITEPRLSPDSVTVTGAASLVEDIAYWYTDDVELENVRDSIHQHIALEEPPDLIELDVEEVLYRAEVAEFTEGEVRIYVRSDGLPDERNVQFSPALVTVRYHVPIDQYARSQDSIPYEAFVSYLELEQDTTGFVTPTIRQLNDELNLRLRSVQPRRVSYYNVLAD